MPLKNPEIRKTAQGWELWDGDKLLDRAERLGSLRLPAGGAK